MSGPGRILVTGATGRLGRLVTTRLVQHGRPVRVYTRRPQVARGQFGGSVEIGEGAFADPDALRRALRGVERLLLLSPIGESLARDQIAVIDAAVAAGVERIVKISGSDWTIDPPGVSLSGDAHAAVEWHLRALALDHVALRPNAFMQAGLAAIIQQAANGGVLNARHGNAPVSYVDARDVADVAAQQLLAPRPADKPLVLTGGAAVTLRQLAGLLASHLHRPIGVADATGVVTPLLGDSFEHRALAQFAGLIGSGSAATVTRVIPALLGRAPRTVEAFITEHFAADAALAG